MKPAPCPFITSAKSLRKVCLSARENHTSPPYPLRNGNFLRGYDRMDFTSSLSRVASKDGWAQVGNGLRKRSDLAENTAGLGKKATRSHALCESAL